MDSASALKLVEDTYVQKHFKNPSKLNYLFLLFGIVSLVAGIISLVYVSNNAYKFKSANIFSTKVLYTGTYNLTTVDWHYIGIGSVIINLPDPANFIRGSFISVAASNDINETLPQSSITVNYTQIGKSLTVTDQALFIVTFEFGDVHKWKHIK